MLTFDAITRLLRSGIPMRANVAIMFFMSCFIAYMLRVNISINLLAMVKDTRGGANLTDYGPRYDWSESQQGYILGAFFWGYVPTCLIGGVMAEWFGGRQTIGYSMVISTFLTALVPLFAQLGFVALFINRFITGLLGGLLYPCLHSMVSKWAPPNEKGKFISALMGGNFGTVITWPLCGWLIETFSWQSAFYVPAVCTAIITALWFYYTHDRPGTHPRITKEECQFIEDSLGANVSTKRSSPPVMGLLKSVPFWALLVLHYGNLWGLFFLMNAAPKFMKEVLDFSLTRSGVLSAIPYLARLICSVIFGMIGDSLLKNNKMETTTIRKGFCLFSHIIPGLFLLVIAYVRMDAYVVVTLMTLSLGFNGASTITNLQNAQDLAPNFAGSIYGAINFVGTTSGFTSPIVVSYFTSAESIMESWSNVFLIGAFVYIVPAIVFILFGSGKIQDYNQIKVKEEAIKDTTAA